MRLKSEYKGRQDKVEIHILWASSWGAFGPYATMELQTILETKTTIIINIWGNQRAIASIKENFEIWLKKKCWISFIYEEIYERIYRSEDTKEEDLNNNQRISNFKSGMPQIA
jgi:hypothetical protein